MPDYPSGWPHLWKHEAQWFPSPEPNTLSAFISWHSPLNLMAFMKIFCLNLPFANDRSFICFPFLPYPPRSPASLLLSFSPLSVSCSSAASVLLIWTGIFIFPVRRPHLCLPHHTTAGDQKHQAFPKPVFPRTPLPQAVITHLGAEVNSGHSVSRGSVKWLFELYVVPSDFIVCLGQSYHASSPDLTQVQPDSSSCKVIHLWLVSSLDCFVDSSNLT